MVRLTITIPDDLYATLSAVAEAEERSLSNCIVVRLRKALARERDQEDAPEASGIRRQPVAS